MKFMTMKKMDVSQKTSVTMNNLLPLESSQDIWYVTRQMNAELFKMKIH